VRPLAYQSSAFAQREVDVVGLRAAHELVPPGRERVDPGGYGIAVTAELRRHEARLPDVLFELHHRHCDPAVAAGRGMQQRAGDTRVAFGDRVGLDFDRLAVHALQRRTAAIDARTDLLDECPATSVLWQFHAEFGGKV
jgi:hypothetical protein